MNMVCFTIELQYLASHLGSNFSKGMLNQVQAIGVQDSSSVFDDTDQVDFQV
jgi:hypothetical protein